MKATYILLLALISQIFGACTIGEESDVPCPTNTTATANLINYMDCLHPFIVRADQMSDTIYTASIGIATNTDGAWQNLMYQLLYVNDNCTSLSTYITGSIAGLVVIKEITVSGKKFCVVHEKISLCVSGTSSTVKRFKYGLGTLAALSTSHSELNVHIQATHPFADARTQEQTSALFSEVKARSLIIAGAHRNANTNGDNPCIGGLGYGRTDASHTRDWGFHQAVAGLYRYLSENFSTRCPLASCAILQFHGKDDSNCSPAQVFLSVGRSSASAYPDDTSLPYYRIKQAIPSAWVPKDPADDTSCDLTATKNVQGRLINGLTSVCGASNNANSQTHSFVHIEQNTALRGSNYYSDWVTVLNTAF